MSDNGPPLEVRLWGDLACFTRPEMKVERVSYPVMTPSAARGALEAIFWKPEFHWIIEEIHVINEIQHISIMRNEVNSRQTRRMAEVWSKGGGGFDAARRRVQRHTLALRDVDYVIRARPVLKEGVTCDVAKYRHQFRRRVSRGKCFATPYLGCREFSASFSEPDPAMIPPPINMDLGLILLDFEYDEKTGTAQPVFFPAKLENGIMKISQSVRKEGLQC